MVVLDEDPPVRVPVVLDAALAQVRRPIWVEVRYQRWVQGEIVSIDRDVLQVAVELGLVRVAGTAAVGWYLARPNPAVLTYAVSTATTGGDSTTRAVLPNFTLRLGDDLHRPDADDLLSS